ncbi:MULTISPECIES: RNA 2',3'-cyclic phosphodiesterase [unclassified Pseudoxanthomonas]|uniref:RNA 2',3'-cyclic phosphodiesterase n=1 Tax=unclassified Pseudoxanthomonas TaxID=2645906 RepID=UPI0030783E79
MTSPQGSLFAPAQTATHKLFFALFPGPEECEHLRQLAASLHPAYPAARWIRPDRYHMTLHYLGESDQRRDDQIRDAVDAMRALPATEPFTLTLDHLRVLGNPRRPALTLAASEISAPMQAFWQALQERLIRAGFHRHIGRTFVPHLTVAYVDPEPTLGAVDPVVLRPAEFRLVHSIQGQPDYEVLGRWPIGR